MNIKLYINLALIIIICFLIIDKPKYQASGEVIFQAQQTQIKTFGNFINLDEKSYLNNAHFATNSAILFDKISARSALALDINSKQVLFSKNSQELLYPASTTKIITALVARDLYQLTDEFTITAKDLIYGNNIGWQAGEKVTLKALLQALLIASSNESGLILANNAPGGYEKFIQLMNDKARSLSLKNSHFSNPQGFDDQRQKTTVHDLALVSLELLRDNELAQIVSIHQTQIANLNGKLYNIKNTNRLFDLDLPFTIKGVKTGTTSLANEALVTLIEKDGHQILLVVLSAKNRYNDTISLINFIFENYIWQKPTSLLSPNL